jgi:hypothetical protein
MTPGHRADHRAGSADTLVALTLFDRGHHRGRFPIREARLIRVYRRRRQAITVVRCSALVARRIEVWGARFVWRPLSKGVGRPLCPSSVVTLAGRAVSLCVTHRNLLFTVAYEMLGSAADAEDVLQESWLR